MSWASVVGLGVDPIWFGIFVAMDVLRVVLLIAVPSLALLIPSTM